MGGVGVVGGGAVCRLPLVDSAPLVPQGDRDCSGLVQAEVLAVVMVVGRDPAHPCHCGVLAGKHPHGVVVLQLNMHKKKTQINQRGQRENHYVCFFCFFFAPY